jgi:hypothetical protein
MPLTANRVVTAVAARREESGEVGAEVEERVMVAMRIRLLYRLSLPGPRYGPA